MHDKNTCCHHCDQYGRIRSRLSRQEITGPRSPLADSVTGALLGWKVWEVAITTEGAALGTVTADRLWASGTLTAECLPSAERGSSAKWILGPHASPDPLCQCGINAMRSAHDVPLRKFIDVVGKVALFGRVVDTDHGYRAERATILELALRARCWHYPHTPRGSAPPCAASLADGPDPEWVLVHPTYLRPMCDQSVQVLEAEFRDLANREGPPSRKTMGLHKLKQRWDAGQVEPFLDFRVRVAQQLEDRYGAGVAA